MHLRNRMVCPKINSMRSVAVIGAGKTRFGAFPDRDLLSLAVEAGEKCLKNGHVSPAQVEAFYLGNFAGPSFVGQNHLAPYVSTALGIHEVPATRFEAACASSGSAFFHAVSAVSAGLYDVVMVLGVEKMTSQPTPSMSPKILASAGDCSGEIRAGSTFPSPVRHDCPPPHAPIRHAAASISRLWQ